MPSAIPIRNVYYLLCYAWNRLEQKDFVDIATAGVTELADLFARVLITGVHRLCRRGLERGYQEQDAEIPGIRGRIDLRMTYARMLQRHGRAQCRFDELSNDTPQNRVVKAALQTLAAVGTLSPDHRGQLQRLSRQLTGVAALPLSRDLLRRVELHANNRHYRFLIDVARLVYQCAVPDEQAGGYRFRDFVRERKEMARLFEAFIFNFLKLERADLKVGREILAWDAMSDDDPDLSLLPDMRTDVTVRQQGRTVVIDAKYYEQTFQQYYDRKALHSANLYQLVAYLRNMERNPGQDEVAEGVLLYPVTSEPVDLTYTVLGHKLRVRTLDLAQEWSCIEADLKALV